MHFVFFVVFDHQSLLSPTFPATRDYNISLGRVKAISRFVLKSTALTAIEITNKRMPHMLDDQKQGHRDPNHEEQVAISVHRHSHTPNAKLQPVN